MTHGANEMPGVGTGNNPRSQKHLRCLTCGLWATPEKNCPRCKRDPLTVPVRLDEPTRRCKRCGVDQPISYFRKMPKAPDGLHPWCRPCSSSYAKDVRGTRSRAALAARRGIPDIWKKGQPNLTRTMEARVWRLLSAASDAASAGLWRGRPGIRAYRDLRVALDEWRAPESERVLMGDESPFEEATA